jgi:hypothetical protein
MVPFLYLVYASVGVSLSAQTVVAHATSLGVAFVTSVVGTWRYARAGAIHWRPALLYSVPGIAAAFGTARLLTGAGEQHWVRPLFGLFLLASAWDMARRARTVSRRVVDSGAGEAGVAGLSGPALTTLVAIGIVGGAASALLGIGGGLIAVPVFLYVARLPVRGVAPTALAGVCLTTLAGGLGYLTAGEGPAVSGHMAGFMDLRMLVPLGLGAVLTVPLGVQVNRRASPPTLYWIFAAVFALIGVSIVFSWLRSA